MKMEERLFDDASAEVQRLPDAKKLSQHEIRELKVLIKDCHCKPPVAVDGTRCLQFLHGGAPGVVMPLCWPFIEKCVEHVVRNIGMQQSGRRRHNTGKLQSAYSSSSSSSAGPGPGGKGEHLQVEQTRRTDDADLVRWPRAGRKGRHRPSPE